MEDIQIHYVPDICFSVFILQKQWGNRKLGGASIFMQYLGDEFFVLPSLFLQLVVEKIFYAILTSSVHNRKFAPKYSWNFT